MDDDRPHLVIWGTDVSASEFKIKFQKFLKTYKEEHADEDEIQMDHYESSKPFYMQKLAEVSYKPITNLVGCCLINILLRLFCCNFRFM